MQTLTHIPIGTLLGAIAFQGQPLAQLACVVASVGPDVVMVPTFVFDKLRGRQPLEQQGWFLLATKELSHSLILSVACLILGFMLHQPLITAFGAGWVMHIVVDILTHGDPYFQSYGDPHYIWPFGSLRSWGIWEYRIKTGQLWPVKPFEGYVLFTSTMITLVVWILG